MATDNDDADDDGDDPTARTPTLYLLSLCRSPAVDLRYARCPSPLPRAPCIAVINVSARVRREWGGSWPRTRAALVAPGNLVPPRTAHRTGTAVRGRPAARIADSAGTASVHPAGAGP